MGNGKLICYFSRPKAAAFRGEEGTAPGKGRRPGPPSQCGSQLSLLTARVPVGVCNVTWGKSGETHANPQEEKGRDPKKTQTRHLGQEKSKSQGKEEVQPKKREKGDQGAVVPVSGTDHKVAQEAGAQRCELRWAWVAAPTALRLPTPALAHGPG